MGKLSNIVISSMEILLEQVPVYGTFSDIFKRYQENKFKSFLQEVKNGTANVTITEINQYDILQSAYLTQLALLKIRQDEKIIVLAKAFSAYCNKIQQDDLNIKLYSNDYEQLLNIIEGITVEELNILLMLYHHECKKLANPDSENYYNDFIVNTIEKNNLDKDYILATLIKLHSTGLCRQISCGVNFSGTLYIQKLTPLFYKLVDYLNLQ